MSDLVLSAYHRFNHLIKYGLIGTFSSALDFCVYTLLVLLLCIPYLVANCISVFSGISTSFFLNRRYNFKVKDHITRRFFIFLTVGLCGLLFSNIVLCVCVEGLLMDQLLSKTLSIVLVVVFQFIANKEITFKPVVDE